MLIISSDFLLVIKLLSDPVYCPNSLTIHPCQVDGENVCYWNFYYNFFIVVFRFKTPLL